MWLEDEMPEIINYLRQAGMYIIDKGEIKIDNEISKWVFFHDKRAQILTIEFYMILENNMFIKLQYSSKDTEFNKYRPEFEELKNNMKVKMTLF